MMTAYVLDHAKDKDVILMYESSKGITERLVHVVAVDGRFIRTYNNGQWRTFARERVLACSYA
jgi:hypothetical protein